MCWIVFSLSPERMEQLKDGDGFALSRQVDKYILSYLSGDREIRKILSMCDYSPKTDSTWIVGETDSFIGK